VVGKTGLSQRQGITLSLMLFIEYYEKLVSENVVDDNDDDA